MPRRASVSMQSASGRVQVGAPAPTRERPSPVNLINGVMDIMDKKTEKPGKWAWLPAAMPKVATLVAERRVQMGDAHVDACFKRGMAGEPDWFFAREGPLAIGTPFSADTVMAAWCTQAIKPGQALVVIRPPQGKADGAH
jgi:hypothetical protein